MSNDGKDISIQQRTKVFAIRVIKAYVELNKKHYDDAAKVLAKQFLRSGTSIGANCAEAKFAQSRADFLSKYSIALKEASECQYWVEVMIDSNIVSEARFSKMLPELDRVIKILISTTKKLKQNK
ncbi:four helix bundle protein [Pleurocapsales cyanobacterium LEGE 10410]|nr:four helix bundle protein [Pleurocapsales cyanobacterium LEGE 10410]